MPLKVCLSKFTYLLCIYILIIATPIFSQSNMLDVTFGNGGKMMTAVNDSSAANAVAFQNDGKIIVAGSTTFEAKEYATLVRYNAYGSLDNTFGAAGKVVSQLPDIRRINAINIQQDGKIVAGGISNGGSLVNGNFTVLRYKIDGSIDSLFGVNGIAKVAMRGLGAITKILIKPDGKILAGGTLGLPTLENIPALALLNTNGIVDSSFGINGRFQDYVSNDTIRVLSLSDMALTSDGKIVATGETNSFRSAFTLFRFLANGTLDNYFGVRGLITTGFYNTDGACQSEAIAVQPNDKIVVAGYSYNLQTGTRFSMTRYNTTGSLDSTFGTDGKVISPPGIANRLLIGTDGNLILTGYTTETSSDFAVARYFANGKTDSTFGANGMITTDFSGLADRSYAAAIQNDGKIILAGQAGGSNNNYSIALARYTLSVMPLKLLSFTAQANGKNNFLYWQTVQEINFDKFVIERSFNAKDYIGISSVNAGLANYSFIDDKPLNGTNYYRLKMIDKDGKSEYSAVRNVVNSNNFYVNVYPLPANNKLNIQILSAEIEKAGISVSDISGKELITSYVITSAGITNAFVNVQKLVAGIYFLKIATKVATETIKIAIAR